MPFFAAQEAENPDNICHFEKIEETFQPEIVTVGSSSTSKRSDSHRILETARQTIRIHADYSGIASLDSETKGFIQYRLIPNVISYFQSFLKVIPIAEKIKVPGSKCYKAAVPSAHRTEGVETDLILYVSAIEDATGSTVAWASSCFLAQDYGYRPMVGQINLIPSKLKGALDPKKWDWLMNMVLHEVTHVLVFSNFLFNYYIDANGKRLMNTKPFVKNVTIRGVTTSMITLPSVVAKAKAHFNCSSLIGLELENQGGAGSKGSHWERRVLHNEVMTASAMEDPVMSEMTLAMFEASGWYDVSYSAVVERLNFGKNRGCGFVTRPCLSNNKANYPEYCAERGQYGCSYSGYKKASCSVLSAKTTTLDSAMNYFNDGTQSFDGYSDNCPYYFGFSNGDCRVQGDTTNLYEETFGSTSRCFAGTYIKSIYSKSYNRTKYHGTCHQSRCVKTATGAYQLQVTINSNVTVTCNRLGENKTIAGYTGFMICPDPMIYCQESGSTFDPSDLPRCPYDCSGRGSCTNGKCTCYAGWTGADCAQNTTIVRDTSNNAVSQVQLNPHVIHIPNPSSHVCMNDCSGNGICHVGTCFCYGGFRGLDCSEVQA